MILIEWFLKGGIFMWPLLICSLLGFAAILDRSLVYWQIRLNYDHFISKLKADLLSRKEHVLPEWVNTVQSPLAKLASVYFEYIQSENQIEDQKEEKIRNEALKREGNRLLSTLDKRMRLLSVLSNVTPLLGLLGTVAGLVTAFHIIELKGGVIQPSDLAGGIWTALITTVAGLCIGIPTFLMHNYFQGKNQTVARHMEELVSELDEIFAYKQSLEVKSSSITSTPLHGSRSYGN